METGPTVVECSSEIHSMAESDFRDIIEIYSYSATKVLGCSDCLDSKNNFCSLSLDRYCWPWNNWMVKLNDIDGSGKCVRHW